MFLLWERDMVMSTKSSTNKKVLCLPEPLCREAMYSMNNNGEMGEPYGVPMATHVKSSGALWNLRWHALLDKQDLIHDTMYGETPLSLKRPVSRPGLMLSKPPLMSRKSEDAFSLSLWAIVTSWDKKTAA